MMCELMRGDPGDRRNGVGRLDSRLIGVSICNGNRDSDAPQNQARHRGYGGYGLMRGDPAETNSENVAN
jgi:hypothetical protein